MDLTRSVRVALALICLELTVSGAVAGESRQAAAAHPRIVNIYNFVRENDFRVPNSEAVLYEATREQVMALKKAKLPATFALQYDALVDTNYQKLFKDSSAANFEIAAWWEIPELLAKKAGLKWRGHHEWDPAANVGFSPGYTPEERVRLVDVYMGDFKAIFGYYPRTVGSWYLDEITLAYMADKYGIVASCNCKDQVGTDGYTLWGGYWNQAYYPSRLNAYIPAQTEAGQINVPVFRMLGSDPIYQHGTTPGLYSLEPVYRDAGGSMTWVSWYMDSLIHNPALAFGYTQAGQENSFGWDAMKEGFLRQIDLFKADANAGLIQVETLAQAGQWFKEHYRLTPSTSVVVLDDWKHENRKAIWYDSRFYRFNLLWQNGELFIRDIHCFDENCASPTHQTALTARSLAYHTLPIVDSALWAKSRNADASYPAVLALDGETSRLRASGKPVVKELNDTELGIQQPLDSGGSFSIVCSENELKFAGSDADGHPLRWRWRMEAEVRRRSAIQSVTTNEIRYSFEGTSYALRVAADSGSCAETDNGDVLIKPNNQGKLALTFETAYSRNANKAEAVRK